MDHYLRHRALIIALVVVAFLAQNAFARQDTIDVVVDGRSVPVSLAGIERRTIVTADRGLRTTFDGVAVRDVLKAAGVAVSGLKGKALAQVVIATGRDGYQVAFAIAEIDSDFTDRIILVADKRDGKPLLPDTGPWQIIVPDEKRPARWVRQFVKLEVRQLP